MAGRGAEPGFVPPNSHSVPWALAAGQGVTGVQRHQNPRPWEAVLEVGGVQRQALPLRHASPLRTAGPSLRGSVCSGSRSKMQRCLQGGVRADHPPHVQRQAKVHHVCLQIQPWTGAELHLVRVAFLT